MKQLLTLVTLFFAFSDYGQNWIEGKITNGTCEYFSHTF